MNHYKSLYFKGLYKDIIKSFSSKANSELSEEEIAYTIGAYFMLGLMEEGDALFNFKFSQKSSQIIARFFKAMSLMRRSQYSAAKKLFAQNYFLSKNLDEYQFFHYQGLAFYRYYTGDFFSSLKHSNSALQICQKYHLSFEQIYVLEILGHLHFQLGMFHKGLNIFSRVKNLAKELECNGVSRGIEMNILGYKLEAGFELDKNIERTTKKLKEQEPKEYYLKAQLNLQLAKAYYLTGDLCQMEKKLNHAAFNIYKTGNKRQSIQLNLGLAHLDFLRGEYQKALFHISNAKQSLIKKIDNVLELKITGLEIRLMKKLKDQDSLNKLLKLESSLDKKYATYLHKIIKNRRKHLPPPSDCTDPIFMLTRSEDLKKQPQISFILKMSELNLLGLLNLFHFEKNQPYAYFNLIKDKILLIDNGDIKWSQPGLTKFQYQFLKFIFKKGKCSKAIIIETLWNYTYDSYTHDPLIYNSIARIRKLDPHLASYIKIEDTIQTTKIFVCLGADIKIKTKALVKPKTKVKAVISDHNLNHRQIELLNTTQKNDMITPADYIQHFNVSRITATRDLRDLKELNYFEKIGSTRSIKYIKI